jgi:hypothetical protein
VFPLYERVEYAMPGEVAPRQSELPHLSGVRELASAPAKSASSPSNAPTQTVTSRTPDPLGPN